VVVVVVHTVMLAHQVVQAEVEVLQVVADQLMLVALVFQIKEIQAALVHGVLLYMLEAVVVVQVLRA
jgi:hypothetical protein